jgi:hypothetical protein
MLPKIYIIFLFYFSFTVACASEIPDFQEIGNSRGVLFLLSTTRSGSNWISASLSAITRKPISWLCHGKKIFDPSSALRKRPSYNRLGLTLISDEPLLYRTHYWFAELMRVPSRFNKLIFITRNPKELLFRQFFLKSPACKIPDLQYIETFFDDYLLCTGQKIS